MKRERYDILILDLTYGDKVDCITPLSVKSWESSTRSELHCLSEKRNDIFVLEQEIRR